MVPVYAQVRNGYLDLKAYDEGGDWSHFSLFSAIGQFLFGMLF